MVTALHRSEYRKGEATEEGPRASEEGRQEALRKLATGRRPGFSLPMAFAMTPQVERGIEELNNFGFRTTALQGDPALVTALPAGHRQRYGFHVSDLWSMRQQQEFLKRLRLERAQFARERQVAFLNYLIQSKKKLSRPVLDALSPRYESRVMAARWDNVRKDTRKAKEREHSLEELELPALSPGSNYSLGGQDKSPTSAAFQTRLLKVQSLITHCQSAQNSLKQDSKALSYARQSLRKTLEPQSASYSPFGGDSRRTKPRRDVGH